jgi:hypothetical protein
MSTHWNRLEVEFPKSLASTSLEFRAKSYFWSSAHWSRGRQPTWSSSSHVKLYYSTIIRGAWYTWLERGSS